MKGLLVSVVGATAASASTILPYNPNFQDSLEHAGNPFRNPAEGGHGPVVVARPVKARPQLSTTPPASSAGTTSTPEASSTTESSSMNTTTTAMPKLSSTTTMASNITTTNSSMTNNTMASITKPLSTTTMTMSVPSTMVTSTTTSESSAMTTTSTAAATMTAVAASNSATDQFIIQNLKAVKNGPDHDITFSVMDLSTQPVDMTNCHIHWHGPHVRRGPIRCENGWFTTSIDYYDDPSSFALSINHAYGETCVGCNDQENEDYQGDVGSCTILADQDHMDDVMREEDGAWESTANRDLDCFVDFDDKSS